MTKSRADCWSPPRTSVDTRCQTRGPMLNIIPYTHHPPPLHTGNTPCHGILLKGQQDDKKKLARLKHLIYLSLESRKLNTFFVVTIVNSLHYHHTCMHCQFSCTIPSQIPGCSTGSRADCGHFLF